jgi:predicted nucleic acid-binding protein
VSGEGARFALDNTAISNFCFVGRMDILRERYGGRLVVTREILTEARSGPDPKEIERAIGEGWIELRRIYADSPEYGLFTESRGKGFGLGEASAMAACSTGGTWVFISDDLDARNEARRRGVGVVGTYGVLARHVAEGRLSLEEGNRLLRRMIDEGFRSHSDNLREEVERLVHR